MYTVSGRRSLPPDPAGSGEQGALLSTTIRVASVPSTHVYVRHLSPVEGSGHPAVERLPDPDPDDAGRSAVSRWWPPAMLESSWVRDHADEFDVFHLQFGFDARTPQQLRELVAELRRAGKPLVYTVHDLRNPHHEHRAEHDAQLDVLIPAADALITLTPGAAEEIRQRWGRQVTVLPHPHVVDFDAMQRVQRERIELRRGDVSTSSTQKSTEFRVGVHVKSLRANMNCLPVIEAIAEVADEIPGLVFQVDGHRDVLTPEGKRYDPQLAHFLADAAAEGRIDVRIHDFFSDDELWHYLAELDLSVLPYRFGTHSGWLEACRDLGTAVLAPSCGYYRDQAPVVNYVNDEDGLDVASLQAGVRLAEYERPLFRITADARRRQRDTIAEAHAALYSGLLT